MGYINKLISTTTMGGADNAPYPLFKPITEATRKKRDQLRYGIDKFCTFTWNNINMFEVFGMFIINNGEDLKFYNGPGFSNTYSQPQFSRVANLVGVSFKQQSISFKVGMYWFDADDYRALLGTLNPLMISFLTFGFEDKYGYQVKLSNISETSLRQPLGKETIVDEEGNILEGSIQKYYTELTLTFEIQGEQCARSIIPMRWESEDRNDQANFIDGGEKTAVKDTDLSTSITANIEINLIDFEKVPPFEMMNISFSTKVNMGSSGLSNQYELFNVTLSSLPYIESSNDEQKNLFLVYESNTGLVYLRYGENKYKILSTVVAKNGKRILENISSRKFFIPGRVDTSREQYFSPDNYIFDTSINCFNKDENTGDYVKVNNYSTDVKSSVVSYARTNVI